MTLQPRQYIRPKDPSHQWRQHPPHSIVVKEVIQRANQRNLLRLEVTWVLEVLQPEEDFEADPAHKSETTG